MLFQQVAEVQNRRLVTAQDSALHRLNRLDLVEHVLHPRVAQVVEQLHAGVASPTTRRDADLGQPVSALPTLPTGVHPCAQGTSPGVSFASCSRSPRQTSAGSLPLLPRLGLGPMRTGRRRAWRSGAGLDPEPHCPALPASEPRSAPPSKRTGMRTELPFSVRQSPFVKPGIGAPSAS